MPTLPSDSMRSPSAPRTASAAESPDPSTATNGLLTVIASRGGDGLGVSVKVEGAGRIFRIEPTRDPNQPRFWCFRVYRCTAAGVVSQTERSWWGAGGMNRADLPAAIAAIRDDPTTWLAGKDLAELRDWMMGASDTPDSERASS